MTITTNQDPDNRPTAGISRRALLRSMGAAGALAGFSSGLSLFATPAGAAPSQPGTGRDTVILTVFLQGAADTLNMVVPYGDPDYYGLRGSIAVPAEDLTPVSNSDMFAFASFGGGFLHSRYEAGDLAVIHAAGSTDPTRSHFSAIANMDTAFGSTGWLRRGLEGDGLLAAHSGLSIGRSASLALAGSGGSAPTIPSIAFMNDPNRVVSAERRGYLMNMYADDARLSQPLAEGFSVADVLASVPPPPPPSSGATQSMAAFGDAAALIQADVGIRSITLELHGWDHHQQEMNTGREDNLPKSFLNLNKGLGHFYRQIGADIDRTVVVVMSEFGRTAAVNGSLGTDHGHGSLMMVMGGGTVGGRMMLRENKWPGLSQGQLHDERDLAITTDFRDVLREVLLQQFGNNAAAAALPGFSPTPVGIFDRSLPEQKRTETRETVRGR